MNLPTLYGQNILVRLQKFYGRQNGTRRHYTKLPGSTASYGDNTETSAFENHANLLGKLTAIRTSQRMAFKVLLNAKVALT